MYNIVLSPISTDDLIERIAKRTAEIISLNKFEQLTISNVTEQQLLTVDELADLLHLKKPTIYSNFSKGLIPGGCKQGKRVMFDKQIILDWIRSGRKLTNAEISAEAETYLATKRRRAKL